MRGYLTCLYVRTSTRHQHLSLEHQQVTCERYFTENAARLAMPPLAERRWIDGATSGKRPFMRRPEAQCLMKYLQRGDHVLVASYDRLGRVALDQLNTIQRLRGMGVTVHLPDLPFLATAKPDDAMSDFVLGVMAFAAEMIRKDIGRKTRESQKSIRLMGGKADRYTKLGWKDVPNPKYGQPGEPKTLVVIDPVGQAQIIDIMHWHSQRVTYREIARQFNFRGVKNPWGRPWHWEAVKRVIQRVKAETAAAREQQDRINDLRQQRLLGVDGK